MKHLLLALVTVVLCQTQAWASWEIDADALKLPPPPKVGSAAERRDFEILLRYQEERTEKQCREADAQSRFSMKTLFGSRTKVLTKSEFTAVERFGNRLLRAVSNAAVPFKKKWERKRPYDVDEQIEPCIFMPGGNTSYPSSHAAAGFVLGEVLAKIFPEKAQLLRKHGHAIGENRVLGGVHHPSDVEAGRLLGRQILEELLKNQEFRSELRELLQTEELIHDSKRNFVESCWH